jgi:SPP1 gp7 family putative phage head morphogenesis protein
MYAVTRALVARWSQAWHEISAEWELVVGEIVAARSTGEVLHPAQIAQLARTQRALTVTADKLTELVGEFESVLGEPLEEIVRRTADMTSQVVASQLPDLPVFQSFTRVDAAAMQQIIDRTMSRIVADSMPLAPDALDAVKASLIRAVPAGWHPDKAAREMLKRTRTGFNGGLARAMRIARTELLDAHRAANHDQMRANDTVTSWIWWAQLDATTCPSCIAQHGTVHPKDEPGPLDHPNGRCTALPKTQTWADLGFPDLDEPADLITTAEDWIRDNPQDALQALGADRYQLLMDGRITISDLSTLTTNDGWRDSYQATPLATLRKETT